jgi:hypothetical protein
MGYTLHWGCGYAVAIYTMAGDMYSILQPSAKVYLSAIATYQMLHYLHICVALKWCHL